MQQWHSRSNIVAINAKGSRISTDVSSGMNLRLLAFTGKHTTHGMKMDIVSYIQWQHVWAVTGKRHVTLCNGQGKIYNSYFKNYQQCTICQGSGRCKYCQGAGNQTMSKLWAPGEAEAYQAAKREGAADGYSSSSSFSSSSSSSGTCPKCGGKGYRPESYTYAAGSSMAPYHNAGGTNCSICNKATDHYHYRCTECKRHWFANSHIPTPNVVYTKKESKCLSDRADIRR